MDDKGLEFLLTANQYVCPKCKIFTLVTTTPLDVLRRYNPDESRCNYCGADLIEKPEGVS